MLRPQRTLPVSGRSFPSSAFKKVDFPTPFAPTSAINSETVTIPPTLVYRLTFRFKHIVLLFAMDKTGKESSCKQEKLLEELGVKRLLLPLPGTKEEILERTSNGLAIFKHYLPGNWRIAVSYTHLDVYKRQSVGNVWKITLERVWRRKKSLT